jgi:hypothetical protein
MKEVAMWTCPNCQAESITARQLLVPRFGRVVICPACKAPLKDANPHAFKFALVSVAGFLMLQWYAGESLLLLVTGVLVVGALASYLSLRYTRLEVNAVEADPDKWSTRLAPARRPTEANGGPSS